MGLLEHLEAIVQFLDADAGQQALRVELNFLQGQLLSLRQEAVEQDSGFQAPVPTRTQLTGTNGARCNLISSRLASLATVTIASGAKTLVGATWHWSDLTFIEPSVVKLDYGKVSVSDVSSFNIAL